MSEPEEPLFEIVCPDGLVRRYPYHNRDDAHSDARRVNSIGCWRLGGAYQTPNKLEQRLPRCAGEPHTVRRRKEPS